MARLSLWGIYQYDPELFSNAPVPDGIDKDALIMEIMQKSGDLYPYYQVPERLKIMITMWFTRRRFDFAKMLEALTKEYNPIENYDRYEDLSRNYTNSGKDSTERVYHNEGESDDTTTLGSKQTTTYGHNTREDHDNDNTLTVAAYNSASYEPRENRKDKGYSSTANSGSDSVAGSGSDTAHNETTSNSSDNSTMNYGAIRDEKEFNHVHGNIGVTTNQQMIEQELDMRIKNDLYSIIAALFEKEFIVQLY